MTLMVVAISEVLCRPVSVVISVGVKGDVVSGTAEDSLIVVASTLDDRRGVVVTSSEVEITADVTLSDVRISVDSVFSSGVVVSTGSKVEL